MKVPFEGVVCHAEKVNLRVFPSTNANVVDVLTEGSRVDAKRFVEQPITGLDDWYEVCYRVPGTDKILYGFIVSKFVEPIEE